MGVRFGVLKERGVAHSIIAASGMQSRIRPFVGRPIEIDLMVPFGKTTRPKASFVGHRISGGDQIVVMTSTGTMRVRESIYEAKEIPAGRAFVTVRDPITVDFTDNPVLIVRYGGLRKQNSFTDSSLILDKVDEEQTEEIFRAEVHGLPFDICHTKNQKMISAPEGSINIVCGVAKTPTTINGENLDIGTRWFAIIEKNQLILINGECDVWKVHLYANDTRLPFDTVFSLTTALAAR